MHYSLPQQSASTDDVTINAALSGASVAVNAGDSIAITAGGVTSSTLALTAVSDISLDAPITSISADLKAGNQIKLDSGASVSSSNFNITSTQVNIDPSASVSAFNLSGVIQVILALTIMVSCRKPLKVIGIATSEQQRQLSLLMIQRGMWFLTNWLFLLFPMKHLRLTQVR